MVGAAIACLIAQGFGWPDAFVAGAAFLLVALALYMVRR